MYFFGLPSFNMIILGLIYFFFKIFFYVDHFKVFIEFITIFFLLYIFVYWPCGMWDLSSLTRDGTSTCCMERQRLNCWTAREVLHSCGHVYQQFIPFY